MVPAWNECEGIERMVTATLRAADDLVGLGAVASVEVVVVDDGSTDGTAELVSALTADESRVRLVPHDSNRGLGAAVRTGIDAATGDLVLYTDADLPVDLREIPRALERMRAEKADVVAAYRRASGADGLRRRGYTAAYDWLVRTVLGLRVRDVNFAFKLFRREPARSLGLRSEGSFIDAELLARFQRSGSRVIQYGVDYQPRRWGRSSLATVPVTLRILRELTAQVRELRARVPRAPQDRPV